MENLRWYRRRIRRISRRRTGRMGEKEWETAKALMDKRV